MALVWTVAAEVAAVGELVAADQAAAQRLLNRPYEIAAALSAAGWSVAGLTAWWNGPSPPPALPSCEATQGLWARWFQDPDNPKEQEY
jgi:hypothetical protein